MTISAGYQPSGSLRWRESTVDHLFRLQLTNLHGDVSAVSVLNPAVTELKGTFRFDEFGNPTETPLE